jgi:adenosylcobinamide-GDP ribazoletransferase
MGIIALALVGAGAMLIAVALLAAIGLLLGVLCLKQIGGQTGDVLGALEQTSETALLLMASALST